MIYTSTRDNNIKISASEAIIKGISPDGGLFVPIEFPDLSGNLKEISGMNYKETALFIFKKFIPEFTEDELKKCIESAYDSKFDCDDAVQMKYTDDAAYLELFHGPTLAFKDMALTVMPHLMQASKKKTNFKGEISILTATSGDTGKAALEGFKNIDGIKISVFFPEDGVSPIQKRQMRTQEGANTFVSGIRGNFDDAQSGVKNAFADVEFNKILNDKGIFLSSANSINLGRLLPQIVYYFYAYSQMLKEGKIKENDKINFVVPTGNFGDILAGYYAEKMGLPVNKLICASNENNVLYDFFCTGTYDKNRDLILTESPSMDILISSNLERLLFDISDGNGPVVKSLLEELSKYGKYTISDDMKKRLAPFDAYFASENEVNESIKNVFEKENYVIDTHTAVAYNCLMKYKEKTADTTPSVVVSTASPYKFAGSVLEALGYERNTDEFEDIAKLSEISSVPVPKPIEKLKTAEIRHKSVCEKDEINKSVAEFLGIK